MGYSYAVVSGHKSNLLCCDVCGTAGGVRKHKCPFNWCQAIALCPACHKAHPEYTSVETHQGCESAHAKFHAQEQHKRDLLAAGKAVRCSASSWSVAAKMLPNGVHVLFKDANGNVTAYVMTAETYEAVGLCGPATVEDYAHHGRVIQVMSVDFWDKTAGSLGG